MIKLVWRFLLLLLAGLGIAWLADRPGSISIQWLGRDIHLSVLVGIVTLGLAFVLLYIVVRSVRALWRTPARLRESARHRRTRKAYESLSRGIVAAGAGDHQAAARHAAIAGETLAAEPLVKLLGAQAAQLRGDRDEVRRVFEGLSQNPDTEVLGLRGLFADARGAEDWPTARKHAEAALARNPRLPWAATAVLQSLIAHKEWEAAARNVAQQAKAGLMARDEAARKQAALLTAQALADESGNAPHALQLAGTAHELDPSLVPATEVLARLHGAAGNARKALKALRATWALSPHRDLAAAAAKLHDDSAENQFERVRDLTGNEPASSEGRIALARAALDAGRQDAARNVLAPLANSRAPASVCALMAEIEDAAGQTAKSRDWLAQAVQAPRDPMWVSDGVAATRWVPVSPVTGELVACEWRVPFATHGAPLRLRHGVAAPAPAAGTGETPSALPPPPDDPGVEQSS
ncbi:MAG: heme biosynthesis protein HemY [Alphaproteobacteria bacterium]|nr:heme biosynthesis protein HemY [Alphaproteobacteria bacterium]